MKIIEDISTIAQALSEDELTQLRIEEELLVMLVKHPKHSLKTKTTAMSIMRDINMRQLELLGALK